MKRIIAAVAAVGAAAITFTPIASAEGADFWLNKEVYAQGEVIDVTMSKAANCEHTVTSPGFKSPIGLPWETPGNWIGKGYAIDTPGTYEATAICAGKPSVRKFTIEAAPTVSDFFLGADVYAPGGQITPGKPKNSDCTGPVTSKGFTAPIELTQDIGPHWVGVGTVVNAPGTYEASMTCKSGTVIRKFEIRGGKVEPEPKQAPKPKVVKPKGAPQTGGGATA